MTEVGINEIITYSSLMVMAVIPIIVGSEVGLRRKEEDQEKMSAEDAMWFPIVGSAVLLSLYLLFEFFAAEYINMLLSVYFVSVALLSVHGTLLALYEVFVIGGRPRRASVSFSVPFYGDVTLSRRDVPFGAVALGVGIWYALTKHWIANNVIGLAFSIQGVALIALGSFKIGVLLLGGLFFYDIFWVFGTPVMVSVAKGIDAPIKVVFPKDLWAETFEFSLLGLGDIVLPGVFLALLLRYDYLRSSTPSDAKKPASDVKPDDDLTSVPKPDSSIVHLQSFSRTFFSVGMVSYVVGLVVTIGIMVFFKSGQPALLYLVPACVGSSIILAVIFGEFSDLWSFGDEDTTKKKKKKVKKSKKKRE